MGELFNPEDPKETRRQLRETLKRSKTTRDTQCRFFTVTNLQQRKYRLEKLELNHTNSRLIRLKPSRVRLDVFMDESIYRPQADPQSLLVLHGAARGGRTVLKL